MAKLESDAAEGYFQTLTMQSVSINSSSIMILYIYTTNTIYFIVVCLILKIEPGVKSSLTAAGSSQVISGKCSVVLWY